MEKYSRRGEESLWNAGGWWKKFLLRYSIGHTGQYTRGVGRTTPHSKWISSPMFKRSGFGYDVPKIRNPNSEFCVKSCWGDTAEGHLSLINNAVNPRNEIRMINQAMSEPEEDSN